MEKKLEYKRINKVNQSSLKKILISPNAYRKAVSKYEESTETHFVFGSLVDDMLLAPKTVDDKYYKMESANISDTLKLITLYVYESVKESFSGRTIEWYPLFDHEYVSFILEGCSKYDYQPRWGNDAKIKNIVKDCSDYFTSLIKSDNKIIISKEDYNKATICVASLKADPYTGYYLRKAENIDIYTHVVIEFEIKGVECKGELDEIYIDHFNKTIQPIDFKTTGKQVNGFEYDFWKYRYDFQAAFYKEGLLQDNKIKKLLNDGYTLLNFKYIVVETESINNPMIFEITDEVNSIGLFGGVLSNGKKLEGVYNALERYKYHSTKKNWDYPKEYYQQEGLLYIKI